MSNLGVFQWIREAVRRSVLLGFSDAVEELGVTGEAGELHPQLTAVLQPGKTAIEHQPPAARSAARPERKRLGRSLEQIRDTTSKPAP